MKYLYLLVFSISTLHAQQWVQMNDLPSPRHHPVTFSLDGLGYMVTGTNTFNAPTDDFYQYDPFVDSWTQLPDFPGPARSFSIGAVYEGKAYMGFGAGSAILYSDLWVYDPNSQQWTELATCPCQPRRHPAFVIENGKIYIGLGDGDFGNLGDWHVYDIASDTWQALPNLPGDPRHHPYMFAAGGSVYTGLGHAGPIIYSDWYRWDPTVNSWSVMNAFPGEARVAGTQFDHDGFGYVLSGDGDNHSWMPTGEFWMYDHNNDSWTQLTPHPGVSRWAPGSFIIDNQLYFFGGINRQQSIFAPSMWKYSLGPASVGLDDIQNEVVLYPNPVKDRLYIDLKGQEVQRWSVMDVSGRIVANGDEFPILTESWPAAYYALQLTLVDGRTIRKRLLKN